MISIDSYTTSPKLDFEDPLQWWRMHSIEYLCLSRLAKKIFVFMPPALLNASSVPLVILSNKIDAA